MKDPFGSLAKIAGVHTSPLGDTSKANRGEIQVNGPGSANAAMLRLPPPPPLAPPPPPPPPPLSPPVIGIGGNGGGGGAGNGRPNNSNVKRV